MLNKDLKLEKKTLASDVQKIPTRNGFGEGLLEAGKKNSDVVALCADLTESTRMHLFAKEFPERFFQIGVAEQNLATVAAGLAVNGKIPFIASYATFSPGRNWEQIRTTISYNNANVKIAGHHAGISVGPDGATHQAIEDIATTRVMANMTVIVPCDAIQAKKATLAAAAVIGPMYLRFSREKTPLITTEETPFTIGKAQVLWEEKKPEVTIFSCGALTHNALLAAQILKNQGIAVEVVNVHTIKPLDEKTILAAVKKSGAVVTVEEHQVLAGLGGAIAELLARTTPMPIEFIGMQNVFGESGDPEALLKKYHMDPESIVRSVQKVLRRK